MLKVVCFYTFSARKFTNVDKTESKELLDFSKVQKNTWAVTCGSVVLL